MEIFNISHDPDQGHLVCDAEAISLDGKGIPCPHIIVIPYEAIVNRMDVYQLDDPKDALVAILQEHRNRLSGRLLINATDPVNIHAVEESALARVIQCKRPQPPSKSSKQLGG